MSIVPEISQLNKEISQTEACSKPWETSKMERCTKIASFSLYKFFIFPKASS